MYWKLSQRSFFGRLEDTIICFRDCLRFLLWCCLETFGSAYSWFEVVSGNLQAVIRSSHKTVVRRSYSCQEIVIPMAKKWQKMVIKWPFMSHEFSKKILAKLRKTGYKKNVICVVAFDPIRIFIDWAHQNDCRTSVLWELLM